MPQTKSACEFRVRSWNPSACIRGQTNIEKKRPLAEPPSNDNVPCQTARGRRGLPWAWIALSSLATFLWLVAIGWFAIQLFRWMVG